MTHGTWLGRLGCHAGQAVVLLATLSAPAWPQAAKPEYATADDGVRLYYHEVGSGPQVVLVPAGLFLERDFASLARGRRMVFYDMRNRGRSDRVTDSARISLQHDLHDLEAVRRQVQAERVALIGWSYLGMLVMRYAAEHPERIERVVQIGPIPRQYGTEYPASLRANDSIPVPDSASRAMLTRLHESGLPRKDPQAYCEREYQILRVRLVGNPQVASRVPDLCALPNEWPTALDRHFRLLFRSVQREDDAGWGSYAQLTFPVLTIHGTQDRNAPYGGGREWAARLPDGRLLTVRGGGHMVWLDAPRVVLPAIDAFLRGTWPRDAVRVP
ncbi:MAG TPA: alpha/beta hydrolase [Gemmatimonadales bacterium]